MLHLNQTIEEFASRRRQAQSDLEDHLRSYVEQALDTGADTSGWDELLDAASAAYDEMYREESGNSGTGLPASVRNQWKKTLQATKTPRDEATRDRITTWLATAILSQASIQAAQDDPAELFLEWVDMHDDKVRPTHRDASGQQQPVGEKFSVGGYDMIGPGDPTVPIELWINCRCTLRPVLAEEALVASFRDVPSDERKKRADDGSAMPDGSYPIANCDDLRNAIQAIGRAKDPAKVKSHIRKRKSALGCPDVELPDTWANEGEVMADEKTQPVDEEVTPPDEIEEMPAAGDDLGVPFHSVLAPEGIKSGDGRKFKAGALRTRPLPLPGTWQKVSDEGHKGNVTVLKFERIARVGNEMRSVGRFLSIPEADEVIGLIAEFGKFGVSIDADDASFEMDDDDESVEFTDARIASACIVPIPAFAEAWIALGEAPEGFMDGEEVTADGPETEEKEALVASATPLVDMFKDLAPGKTEDGPGWLTHPVDTDRLRDYWVRGPGAAKINWGVAGDFNRCRLNVAEYIKPQYLNGYCANRHYDALGFWPGRPVAGETEQFAGEKLEVTEKSGAVALVASGGRLVRNAEFFRDPGFEVGDDRLVLQSDGSYACPLTITEDGHVFGHLARWGTCHIGLSGTCTTPPHSETGYANFLTGATRTDEGIIPTGRITLGTGHAGLKQTAAAAMAHYDNTGVSVADINVGEDTFGIWFSGQIKPGVKDEVIDELATSGGLSGDWRYCGNGVDDLVAALAVNVGGFTVQRVAASVVDGQQIALVASGFVERPEQVSHEKFDVETIAAAVVKHIAAAEKRKERMAEIAAKLEEKNGV